MFFSPGLEQFDPALLAFLKCHVTSPVKWEVLRVLAGQNGAWIRADDLARRSHRQSCELTRAVAELAADGVVEVLPAGVPDDVSYRLPADEPTSVVLRRLMDAATHSQELRAIIAAHLQHERQHTLTVGTSAAA
ncbi:MAG: hypothetical protein LC797_05575 [Chloroflexi bacterium]|nr:hypothetical protein [Chloroflexota bacterium]